MNGKLHSNAFPSYVLETYNRGPFDGDGAFLNRNWKPKIRAVLSAAFRYPDGVARNRSGHHIDTNARNSTPHHSSRLGTILPKHPQSKTHCGKVWAVSAPRMIEAEHSSHAAHFSNRACPCHR
jgi:hypothetical protein